MKLRQQLLWPLVHLLWQRMAGHPRSRPLYRTQLMQMSQWHWVRRERATSGTDYSYTSSITISAGSTTGTSVLTPQRMIFLTLQAMKPRLFRFLLSPGEAPQKVERSPKQLLLRMPKALQLLLWPPVIRPSQKEPVPKRLPLPLAGKLTQMWSSRLIHPALQPKGRIIRIIRYYDFSGVNHWNGKFR